MCLILLAWQANAEFPLVVAANRDEFYARPTRPAGFWPDAPQVLAGRDDSAGGTWLGFTRSGRFAALTNYRAPEHARSDRPSRGKLVADFLTGEMTPAEYLAATAGFGKACNGYNLLVGTRDELWWSSNVSGESRQLAAGVYGLSNHLLDTAWPKVGAGRTALTAALGPPLDELALSTLLCDDTRHEDQKLPQTGIPLEWERALSAAFIHTPAYGTRASTLLKVRSGSTRSQPGMACLDEQTWLPGGRGIRRRFSFPLQVY